MRYWIVKGKPSQNRWDEMLVPGKSDVWYSGRRPRAAAALDRVFFWESSPKRRLIALGGISNPDAGRDSNGDALFELEYFTKRLDVPLTIDRLRKIPALRAASFLKAGPSGTVFPLTDTQAQAILEVLVDTNPQLLRVWSDVRPEICLSTNPGILEGIASEITVLRRSRCRKFRSEALERAGGVCEACEVDFSQILDGIIGHRALNVHHRLQLALRRVPTVTTASDLAVVCANCHAMIHANPSCAMPVEQLRELWQETRCRRHEKTAGTRARNGAPRRRNGT